MPQHIDCMELRPDALNANLSVHYRYRQITRGHILENLDVKDRTQAATLALRRGIISIIKLTPGSQYTKYCVDKLHKVVLSLGARHIDDVRFLSGCFAQLLGSCQQRKAAVCLEFFRISQRAF